MSPEAQRIAPVLKAFAGSYWKNGSLRTFNIQAADKAEAVSFIEGKQPFAVHIESIKEVAKF